MLSSIDKINFVNKVLNDLPASNCSYKVVGLLYRYITGQYPDFLKQSFDAYPHMFERTPLNIPTFGEIHLPLLHNSPDFPNDWIEDLPDEILKEFYRLCRTQERYERTRMHIRNDIMEIMAEIKTHEELVALFPEIKNYIKLDVSRKKPKLSKELIEKAQSVIRALKGAGWKQNFPYHI